MKCGARITATMHGFRLGNTFGFVEVFQMRGRHSMPWKSTAQYLQVKRCGREVVFFWWETGFRGNFYKVDAAGCKNAGIRKVQFRATLCNRERERDGLNSERGHGKRKKNKEVGDVNIIRNTCDLLVSKV